jgi:hypothetical protein
MNLYAYCGNNSVNGIDPFGLWDTATHNSFGSGRFDYGRLDNNFWTSPYNLVTGTWRHFRSREDIAKDLRKDIQDKDRNGGQRAFEEHMHEWQDSYVHYDQGYRYPFGHLFDGTAPDDVSKHQQEYNEAQRTTQEWEQLWDSNPSMEDLANEGENWAGRNS